MAQLNLTSVALGNLQAMTEGAEIGEPGRAFESEIEVSIELLEALPVTPDTPSYPLPGLRRTDQIQPRTFSTLVLENRYLRAEFVPALGGRLLKLWDRRLGVELLHGDGPLPLADDPVRGARLEAGLGFTPFAGRESLGPVQAQLDAEENKVWFAEILSPGLSYHLGAWLEPEAAILTFEVRLVNRTLEPIGIQPGLSGVFSQLKVSGFPEAGPLPGRTSLSFPVEILPLTGVGEVMATSSVAIAGFSDETLLISSLQELSQAKLILLSAGGQTLETTADLQPERVLKFPFPEVGGQPKGLVIHDASGAEVLRFPIDPAEPVPTRAYAETSGVSTMSEAELGAYQDRIELRHLIAARRALEAFKNGEFNEAGLRAEQSLLYNGDDHLAWIEKAVAARYDVTDSELEIADAGELANGHFLAPLEPLLRAEAYFRMPEGVDAITFLDPLKSFPDELIEVACFLIERGLFVDANRWLHYVQILAPSPMAAYLSAYGYLTASQMKTQAAELVGKAAKMPLTGPFPWRSIERTALEALSEAFPNEARLAEFLAMANRRQEPAASS